MAKVKVEFPIKLDLNHVLKSCRKAYEGNRLTAQHEQERKYFGHKDTVCAIGAAFPKSHRSKFVFDSLLNKATIGSLLAQRTIEIKTEKVAGRIQCLQARHDDWTASQSKQGRVEAEAAFLNYLEFLENEPE